MIHNKQTRFYPRLYPAVSALLIIIRLLLFFNEVNAQNPQIDSIDRLIAKTTDDTTRINMYIDKVNLLAGSDLNAAIALGKEQLIQSEKINYYKGIVMLRGQLASNNIFTGNYELALDNLRFLEKFVKPKDSIRYSATLSIYGMMYGVKGVYDSSIWYYSKAIEINERIHNNIELPGNYANISIGYQQLANYPMALEYQQRSLTLTQKLGLKPQQARTMLNMAITYQNIGDTSKAIEMYEASIQLAEKINSRITQLYGYSNLATIYLGKKEWTKVYNLGIKAAELAEKSGDIGIQAASLSKAAQSLAFQNKFAEATALSKRSIALADSSKQPKNISQALQVMATTLFLQKKYTEAIPYFEKSLQIVQSDPAFDRAIVEAYIYLSQCYEYSGNYKKALENYQMSVNITDSMRRKENIRKATELSMNFEFQKKQEVQKAEQVLKDSITRSKQIALLVGLGIFLLLAVFAFIGFKNKQKANKLLKEQKLQIESTLDKLKSTQAQLIQSEKMASLGELTAGIAHEIQNPLNFVNNFSDINKDLLAEMKEEISKGNMEDAKAIADDVIANEEKINQHGKRAEDIVKGMLQHSRKSEGNKELTDINALCEEYLRLSYHGLRAKDKSFNAKFKTSFDESVPKINVVPQDIGRVILNLINNAFYAVNEKSKNSASDYESCVCISTKKLNDKIEIRVDDNGNGIPKNLVDKIFQPFFTTKPTGSGTGLGLSLSYDIVKAHGGDIKVESKEGESSLFIIQLPAIAHPS